MLHLMRYPSRRMANEKETIEQPLSHSPSAIPYSGVHMFIP